MIIKKLLFFNPPVKGKKLNKLIDTQKSDLFYIFFSVVPKVEEKQINP